MTTQAQLDRALAIKDLVEQHKVVQFNDPKSNAQIVVHTSDCETMSIYVVNENGIASSLISVDCKEGQKKTWWALHELFNAIVEDESAPKPEPEIKSKTTECFLSRHYRATLEAECY